MTRVITIILAAVAISAAGCGGGGSGIDTSDPEAVAKAYVESFYRCGADGAGVRARYAYPETAAAEHREQQREEEEPGGCTTRPVTPITTTRRPGAQGVAVVVEVSSEDCRVTAIPMVEVDGSWLVDESEIDPHLICSPYQT